MHPHHHLFPALPLTRAAFLFPEVDMQCSQCGGLVTWRGPLSALSHTECHECGAVNSQLYDGTYIENHCPECGEFDSECLCGEEVA
jgi:phage FluMu protein Com